MNAHQFQFLARRFRAGKISLNEFTDQLLDVGVVETRPPNHPIVAPTSSASSAKEPSLDSAVCLDVDRLKRCGYPEVVLGIGKTSDEIRFAVNQLIAHGQNVLVTRLDPAQAKSLSAEFDDGCYNRRAGTFRINRFNDEPASNDAVAIVTAGTGDRAVAEEARETLIWMNRPAPLICDVGVAGPHRLTKHLATLKSACVVIAVAGADGALPSVVAGHLACPVIAVPTSIGYGASFGGIAALLSMINSCAANVAVVNIDAGFKAGFLAGLIAARTTSNAPS